LSTRKADAALWSKAATFDAIMNMTMTCSLALAAAVVVIQLLYDVYRLVRFSPS